MTAAIGITFGLINFLSGGSVVANYVIPAVFILAGGALLLRPGTRSKKPAQDLLNLARQQIRPLGLARQQIKRPIMIGN